MDNAEAITSSGRASILEMVKYVNGIMNKLQNTKNDQFVIAGDTDSVAENTIVTIDNQTIKQLFDKYKKIINPNIKKNGTEYIDLPNNSNFTYTLNGISSIKTVSRHKISKSKYKISIDNNYVEMTNDHSIMILRNNKIIECKPSEILETDFLYFKKSDKNDYELVSVNSDRVKIEQIGNYNNEYVYDLEVEDNSHTFTANNILVHNSIYVRLDAVLKHLFGKTDIDWFDDKTFKKLKDFVDGPLQKDINGYCADFVCDHFKTDQRRIEFKREKISAKGDYIAKKRYAVLVRDNEGITYNDKHFSYTGVDIKKNELPESIKTLLRDCIEGMISDDWTNDKFQQEIRKIWDIFRKMPISDLSFIKNLNTPKASVGFLDMEKGSGAHAKAAEYYNQIIQELHLEGKHELIKPSDRFHYFYVKTQNKYNLDVIGYKDRWPKEFDKMFEIDYEKMFDKTVISPLKKFIITHNFANFDPSLQIITGENGQNLFDL